MDTKQQILTAAYQLFQERSYKNVSVLDICNACQLTKPAFYYHFSSKAELLIYYYDNAVDALITNQPTKITNYWKQLVKSFSQLMQASINIGVDLTSHLFITNLTQNQGTFDFDQRFERICVDLILKAQQHSQIQNHSQPLQLFIAASILFTGYNVYWAIANGNFELLENFIASLEAVFDVPEEHRISKNDLL